MPCYDLLCQSEECQFEWEDILSLNEILPNCPQCNSNNVKKLMSAPALGRVELTGQELRQKIKQDAKKIKQKASSNEKFLANITGEDKFQKNTVQWEKDISNLSKKK